MHIAERVTAQQARRRRRVLPLVAVGLFLALCGAWATLFSGRVLGPQQAYMAAERGSERLQGEKEGADRVSEAEREFERGAVSEDASVNFLDPSLEDPLASHIVGFPMKPMTLEEMGFCDEEKTIILSGSIRCAEDPSCLACIPQNQVERFNEIHAAFRDPDIETARRAQLLRDFKGQETVALFTFNFAHTDLFLNWACSAQKLGIDVKAFTLVIPCDSKTTEVVKSLGFKYIDPSWQGKLSKTIRESESYWGQNHADINNIALFAMNDLVDLGFHVFVHDADVAWIQNPLPFFRKAIRRRDFLGMLAPFWNSMGPVNTGLLYLAPTFQSKVFLKSMENAAIIKGTSDQKLWNLVLRHYSFQQLEWRLLPQALVYKYSGRRAPPPGEQALLIHALGSRKREKLSRHNLWLLKPECPFYNAEAAALSINELADAKKE